MTPITRREAGALLAGGATSAAEDAAGSSIARAHEEIWKRFLDPKYDTFYDYAGLRGEVVLPTAEECRECKPNALAWWIPIENGAFFGGLYLDSQCRRWRKLETRESARKAQRIAAGLVRLATVTAAPGFIARGVTADGRSHPIAGSDDQTFPWFYGLWRYVKSGLPDAAERKRTIRLMDDVAVALRRYEWRMPCDREGFGFRGTWMEPNFIHAARLLFVCRAMYDLTGRPEWLEEYRRRAREKAAGWQRTRLELCAAGATYEPPGNPHRYPVNPPFWTSASSQAALNGLASMETDPGVKAQYREGLDINARAAAAHVGRWRGFDNGGTAAFVTDWRFLNELWKPQALIQDAVTLAGIQLREWNKRSPRRRDEAEHMREPLFAAWVVTLSGNPEIVEKARPEIEGALRHYDWGRLYTSLFFIAECVFHQL